MSDVLGQMWWYLGRSSGVVATVLVVAALVWGLCFSARATGRRRRPAWWLDLHRYLGGLAFVFVVVHIVAVFQDELSGIGLTQVLVPFTAEGWRIGIGLGVLASYGFAVVVLTSWPKRRLPRRAWLVAHLLSVPASVFAGVHAWMAGSSRDELWFRVLLVGLIGSAVHPAVLRLLAAERRRRAMVGRRSSVAPPSHAVRRPSTAPPVRDVDRSSTAQVHQAPEPSVSGGRR